jgi:hypothetical protein
MTDPGRWLDARRPPAPPSIREAMDPWLREADPNEALHRRLALAGIRALEAVVARPSERNTATALLAADALLTYACEAAAEAGPHALDRLTGELGFDRFSQLIPETA